MKNKSFKLLLGICVALVLMIACAFTVFATSDSPCSHDNYYYDSSYGQYYCCDCFSYFDADSCFHNDYYFDSYYGYKRCNTCGDIFDCEHYSTYNNGYNLICEGCGESLDYNECEHKYSVHYDHDKGQFYCHDCGTFFDDYDFCSHEYTHYSSSYQSMICNSCGAPVDADLSGYKTQTILLLAASILLAPWILLLCIIIIFIVGAIIFITTPVLLFVGIPVFLSTGILFVF